MENGQTSPRPRVETGVLQSGNLHIFLDTRSAKELFLRGECGKDVAGIARYGILRREVSAIIGNIIFFHDTRNACDSVVSHMDKFSVYRSLSKIPPAL